MSQPAVYAGTLFLHDEEDVISYYVTVSKQESDYLTKVYFMSGLTKTMSCATQDEITEMLNAIIDESVSDYHHRNDTSTGITNRYRYPFNKFMNACGTYLVLGCLLAIIMLQVQIFWIRCGAFILATLFVAGKNWRLLNVRRNRSRSESKTTQTT